MINFKIVKYSLKVKSSLINELVEHIDTFYSQKISDLELTNEYDNPDKEFFDGIDIDVFKFMDFKNLTYNSFYITVYSYFEHFYVQICNKLYHDLQLKLKVKDLRADNDIDRCNRYLKKIVDIDLSDINNSINKLNNHRKLRNIIVHHNGNLYKGNYDLRENPNTEIKTLLNIIKEYKDEIDFDRFIGRFTIEDKNFIIEFNNLISEFFKIVIDKVDEKYNKIANL